MPGLAQTLAAVFSGGVIVALLMFILWVIQRATSNAGIVDAGWAAGLAVLSVWYALWLRGGTRAWLFAVLVTVWAIRLAGYLLLTRVIGHPEDPRYVEMRRVWGRQADRRFLGFFETQALVDIALSLPMLLVAREPAAPGPVQWIATALWAVAITGEVTADRQLRRFKDDGANRGRVCDAGLWKYSRHPNYFFEWLTWVAYALFAATAPYGWLAWTAPALMCYFLFRVTGIPLAEAQALRSRGDAYRRYQASTSVFVPWFRR